MHADVLVELAGVVERDALEALQVRRDLVELREPPAALLLDAHLDLAYPAALELDALCDDFRLQASEARNFVSAQSPTVNFGTHRSLMISLWVSSSSSSFLR